MNTGIAIMINKKSLLLLLNKDEDKGWKNEKLSGQVRRGEEKSLRTWWLRSPCDSRPRNPELFSLRRVMYIPGADKLRQVHMNTCTKKTKKAPNTHIVERETDRDERLLLVVVSFGESEVAFGTEPFILL